MREITPEVLKNLLRELNPHWESGEIDRDIKAFQRRKYFDLFFPLIQETSVNRAIVLMGPRRVGKTVMLQQSIQELIDTGSDPASIIYLPLDIPLLQGVPLRELIGLFAEAGERGSLKGCTIIFDEIQYLENWSGHLKTLVDQFRGTRFIASGSAAAALKLKSRESGAGRFTDFTLPPLTFYEFLNLRELAGELFEKSDSDQYSKPKNINLLNKFFIDYINYGGYPEAVFSPQIQKNPERFIRSDIIDKVLLRDLPSLYGIRDVQELTRLFTALAYQTGNEVTYEELSRKSGMSKHTLKKNIEYLEAAFLIKTLNRVDNTGKTFKRVNYFKVYLTNPSMYAALFGPVKENDDAMGSLVETALVCQMMHSEDFYKKLLFYGKWKKGRIHGEVDIIFLDTKFNVESCMEIKWSDRYFEKPYELKSLRTFCKDCGLDNVLVTTRSIHGNKRIEDSLTFHFIESALSCLIIGKELLNQKKIDIHQFIKNMD